MSQLASSNLNDAIEEAEAALLHEPQISAPVTHRFEKGLYIREIFMPKGTAVIGHEHKTRHWNIVLTGRALVSWDGNTARIEAPHCFISESGVRKVLIIEEDMIWQTLHPTDETNLEKLEELLIVKSASYLAHFEDMKRLKAAAALEPANEPATTI